MKRIAVVLMTAALIAAVNAEVIYHDDFQAYAVANPAGADFQANWTVGGPGGVNSSRIYDTANFAGSRVWITFVDNTSITTQNGIAVESDTLYEFSVMLACETFDGNRQVQTSYDLLIGPDAAAATSAIGGPVTVIAKGDNWLVDDSKEDHFFTQAFKTQTLNPGDKLFIRITFIGAYSGSKPFFCVDDVTVSKPSYPVLTAPANGAADQAVDVQLSWDAPTLYTPEGFNVYVATSEPNLTAAMADRYSAAQAGTTYIPDPALESGKTYYWRVEALEPNDVAPYAPILNSSEAWSFTTLPESVVIVTSPLSQTVAAGEAIDLTVTALNAESYQWYKDGAELTGKTTATLTLTDVQLADEGFYTCEISNSLPSSAISADAHIMVQRLVAHWTLNGTLEAIESNPAENWDGIYMNVAEPPAVPTEAAEPVTYITGADGTVSGAVQFTGGRVVMIPDSNDVFNFHQGGLTLAAWVKGPTGGDYRRFVNKADSYAGAQHNSNAVQLIIEGGGWVTAVPAAEGSEDKWRFVALTYDPVTAQRVVYGAYDDTDAMTILHNTAAELLPSSVTSGTTPLVIGGASMTNSYYNYLGSVDDIRIYNYPLTQTQIADVYKEMNSNWICMGISDLDTTGPQGVPDCRVDIYEIAEIGLNWLNCGRMPDTACSQ